MMPLFTGSELVVAFLLAGWLAWTGAGGILGGRILARRGLIPDSGFGLLALAAGLLIPSTVLAIRLARAALVETPGALPPFGLAIAACLLLPAPFCLLYGSFYNAASLVLAGGRRVAGGISRAYVLEALGALVGATLFAFLVVPVLSQLAGAVAAAVLVMAAVIPSAGGGGRRPAGIVVAFIAGLLLVASAPGLDRATAERLFRGYRVERFGSSRYGEIAVVSRGGMRTFFSGGGRLFSVPEPERTAEAVHLPLLLHPSPRRVLIVGGALGGGIEAAAMHPSVREIDCVELDGKLLDAALEAGEPAPETRPAVRFVVGDARAHLARTPGRYDVVILGLPPPLTLLANRCFTAEFFAAAGQALCPGGIVCCRHPAAENFVSAAEARVLGTLDRTICSALGGTLFLPGAWIVAPADFVKADTILARLESRGVEAEFLTRGDLPYRFSPERLAWFRTSVDGGRGGALNTDARPVLPLQELALEGRRIGSTAVAAIGDLAGIDPRLPPAALGLVVFVVFIASLRRGRAAGAAIWGVGLAGFLAQIVVLLAFQSRSGLLYHGFVLLTALFMAGAAAGAIISIRGGFSGRGYLRLLHALFLLHAAALAWWVVSPSPAGGAGPAPFILAAALGMLTGAYYPAVVAEAYPGGATPPALFYSLDLFGACIGALAGGIVLVPVSGFEGTILLVAGIHAAAAVIVAGRW